LRLGKTEVFELQLKKLAGAQTVQQHQCDEAEIAKGAKAAPELSDLLRGKRDNQALRFLEPETGKGGPVPAVAERATSNVCAHQGGALAENVVFEVETMKTPQCYEAVIDSLRCGLGLLVELISDVVE